MCNVDTEIEFGEIIQNLLDPVVVISRDGQLHFFNKAFIQLIGFSEAELCSLDWRDDLTPPENLDSEEISLDQLRSTGLPQSYEKEFFHKDGTRLRVRITAFLPDLNDHELVFAIMENLSGWQRPVPNKSGQKAADPPNDDEFYHLDANFIIQETNQRLLQMLGYRQETDVRGQEGSALLGLWAQSQVMQEFATIKEGKPGYYNIALSKYDGTCFKGVLSIEPLFKSGVLSGLLASLKDISLSKDPFSRSAPQSRFQTLSEQLQAGICEISPDLLIVSLNEFARRLLGIVELPKDSRLSLRNFLSSETITVLNQFISDLSGEAPQRPAPIDLQLATGERVSALLSVAPATCVDGSQGYRVILIAIKPVSSLLPDNDFFEPFQLTRRERMVAELLIRGHLYKEIAAKLGITMPTVRTHVDHLYRKMSIHSKSDLNDLVEQWRGQNPDRSYP